jgi:hypothetical protein
VLFRSAKVPRLFKLGRPDIDIAWGATSKTSGSLKIKDIAQVSPWFDVGLMQFFLDCKRTTATARVEWTSPVEFFIHLEWVTR